MFHPVHVRRQEGQVRLAVRPGIGGGEAGVAACDFGLHHALENLLLKVPAGLVIHATEVAQLDPSRHTCLAGGLQVVDEADVHGVKPAALSQHERHPIAHPNRIQKLCPRRRAVRLDHHHVGALLLEDFGRDVHAERRSGVVVGRPHQDRDTLLVAGFPAHEFVVVHFRKDLDVREELAVFVELLTPPREQAPHRRVGVEVNLLPLDRQGQTLAPLCEPTHRPTRPPRLGCRPSPRPSRVHRCSSRRRDRERSGRIGIAAGCRPA